jgi:hypothetical protein
MLFAAVLCAAEKKVPKPKPAPAAQLEIPKGAVKVDAATYRFTDEQGRTWLYRRTPFGVARVEERTPSAEEAKQKAKMIELTKAVERGDEIHFERPGPFGSYRWQRKKSELNDIEKAAWERDRRKPAAAADQE